MQRKHFEMTVIVLSVSHSLKESPKNFNYVWMYSNTSAEYEYDLNMLCCAEIGLFAITWGVTAQHVLTHHRNTENKHENGLAHGEDIWLILLSFSRL